MADHREFAERFKLACDRNPNVPPHGQGQQVWFRDRLGVSQEAVRKWLAGLAKPKPKLLTQLAHLLDVDEAWLAVGKAPEMTKKQEKQYREQTEGAVYLVFGLFMSAGYSCAFGETGGEADFFAIRSGKQIAVAVTVARMKTQTSVTIPVSNNFRSTVNVAVVIKEDYDLDLLVMDVPGIEQHASPEAGVYRVEAKVGKDYKTQDHVWARLKDSGLLVV